MRSNVELLQTLIKQLIQESLAEGNAITTTTATPPIVTRARKVASLLSLAHFAGVLPASNYTLSEDLLGADLDFLTLKREVFDSWAAWLNPTVTTAEHGGKRFTRAAARVELGDWGPTTVRFTLGEPLDVIA